jgi:hypothetical protein
MELGIREFAGRVASVVWRDLDGQHLALLSVLDRCSIKARA